LPTTVGRTFTGVTGANLFISESDSDSFSQCFGTYTQGTKTKTK